MAVPEVDPEHGAGEVGEGDQDRWPATAAAAAGLAVAGIHLDQQSLVAELRDDSGDGRAGEPGLAGDLCLADHAVLSQLGDHRGPAATTTREPGVVLVAHSVQQSRTPPVFLRPGLDATEPVRGTRLLGI